MAVSTANNISAVCSGRDTSAAATAKSRTTVGTATNISADRPTRNISPVDPRTNTSTVGHTLGALTTSTARNILATGTAGNFWAVCPEGKRSAVCSAKKERAMYISDIVSKLQRMSSPLIRRSEAIENLLGVMWNDGRYLKGIEQQQAKSSALKTAPVSNDSTGKSQLLELASELMFKRRQESMDTQRDTVFVPIKTQLAATEVEVIAERENNGAVESRAHAQFEVTISKAKTANTGR